MKYLLTGLILCCILLSVQGQHNFKAKIQTEENTPLAGASITWKQGNRTVAADSTGIVLIENIPQGMHTFIVTYIGFEDAALSYNFPLVEDTIIVISLEASEDEQEEEVVVTATRTSRSITNTPTRTEVISGEELTEKANMKPGEIRMLLSESTGIQTQQTSATSYNYSIRIQGLDGRYTQILRDGYPMYAGFSGGLSIMQVAPLDLRQVEVIKGSASTLYGEGR